MLFCETAGTALQDVEDLAVFVSQLAALGIAAHIPASGLPAGLPRNARYDVAPHLSEARPGPEDRLVLLAAHRLTDDRLVELRRLAGPDPVPSTAIGAFASRQAVVGTRAKLSYLFGRDPEILDLGPETEARAGSPVFGALPPASGRPPARKRLLLVAPPLDEPAEARALVGLALSSGIAPAILTDGESKQAWTDLHGNVLPVFHLGEVLPAGLARLFDIAAYFAPLPSSYRAQSLLANMIRRGVAVIDGTPRHEIAAGLDGLIPGPPDISTLARFLPDRILPNLARLAREGRRSTAAKRFAPDPVLAALGLADASSRAASRPAIARRGDRPAGRRVAFMPTNGIGLGHAQRCARIAACLTDTTRAVFAAFPGCMGLVRSHGFDVMPLVSRSALHALPYENDLPNYLRLRALTREADALVFDGGYVFDSVYRTILESGIPGIWIRRGLWQNAQDNSLMLDREKAFTRVIVPGEAFPELDRDYSRGPHLRHVGPIVAGAERSARRRPALREALAGRFRPFAQLVVSLLGAGVAADRSAQIQALAAMFERRADVLHLVVVWPSAVLHPSWFGWRNTRIVKTRRAGMLASAADLLVSAAGYNSFLEILYGRLPAIFIPQMGPFMDDQRARARAAVDRDLAVLVEPTDLVTLDRMVGRMLDGEAEALRARLAGHVLPAPGTAAAARAIEEALDER
jgi:hypothetical protein